MFSSFSLSLSPTLTLDLCVWCVCVWEFAFRFASWFGLRSYTRSGLNGGKIIWAYMVRAREDNLIVFQQNIIHFQMQKINVYISVGQNIFVQCFH